MRFMGVGSIFVFFFSFRLILVFEGTLVIFKLCLGLERKNFSGVAKI